MTDRRPVDLQEVDQGEDVRPPQRTLPLRPLWYFLVSILVLVPVLAIVVFTINNLRLKQQVTNIEQLQDTLRTQINQVEILQEINRIERQFRRVENFTFAINSYERLAAKSQEPHPQVLARLAALAVGTGNEELLSKVLERAAVFEHMPWEIYTALAYFHVERGEELKAIEAGQKALELNEYDAQTYNNLAWIYATSNNSAIHDLRKAEDYATRAVEYTNSRSPEFLDTLAEVYYRSGKISAAIDTINRAIREQRGRHLEYYKTQLKTFESAED